MTEPLTIRLENDRAIISRDDGSSVLITGEAIVDQILLAASQVLDDESFSCDIPSASTLGILAESKLIKPIISRRVVPSTVDHKNNLRLKLGSIVKAESHTLREILDIRTSKRDFNAMLLEDLATVLVRSGRIINWSEGPDGYQTSHRPTPSAGARHPIEIKVLALDVTGLDNGLWSFDPVRCELVKIDVLTQELMTTANIIKDVGNFTAGPAAVIFLVAHFFRTLSRYPNGASLIWRDAGVMAAILHLCATDIALASCIVGTCQVLKYDEDNLIADICALAVGGDKNTMDLSNQYLS